MGIVTFERETAATLRGEHWVTRRSLLTFMSGFTALHARIADMNEIEPGSDAAIS